MKNKLIHFKVDGENLTGILNGAGIVVLSIMMAVFDNEIASIILRDILMILILGFFVPLYFTVIVHKKSVAVLGIHRDKLAASLGINGTASVMLLGMFLHGNTEEITFSCFIFFRQ